MTCKATHAGKISAGCDVLTGVRQGCLLSPLLFLLTGLQERLLQTRETESSGHCWPRWTTLAMLMTWLSFCITYGNCRRKHRTWTTTLHARLGLHILRRETKTLRLSKTTEHPVTLSGGATWGSGIFSLPRAWVRFYSWYGQKESVTSNCGRDLGKLQGFAFGDCNGNGLVPPHGNLLVPSPGKLGILKGGEREVVHGTLGDVNYKQKSRPWARVGTS